MPKKELIRELISDKELEQKIESAIKKVIKLMTTSYGSHTGDSLIEYRYGEPMVSHDGITNLNKLIVEDPTENAIISIIRQASEATNRVAGDGTTLTAILTCMTYIHFKKLQHQKDSKFSIIETRKEIKDLKEKTLKYIKSNKIKTSDKLLKAVARISSGNDNIGSLIYDSIKKAGDNGSISITEHSLPYTISEEKSGITIKKGIKAPIWASDPLHLRWSNNDVSVIISDQLITKNEDILPLINKLVLNKKSTILLIADISGKALESLALNKAKGLIDISIIEPPADYPTILQDIATYCNAKIIRQGDPDPYQSVGTIDRAFITQSETILTQDDFKSDSNQDRTPESERFLSGKTIEIKVGANTQAERQELRLRIEDAVSSTQTAKEYGVVSGGGTFLRDSSLSPIYSTPYLFLTKHLNLDKDHISLIPKGSGYDTGTGTFHKSMLRANIADSAKAIEEAVKNSLSSAEQLLNIKTSLIYKYEDSR